MIKLKGYFQLTLPVLKLYLSRGGEVWSQWWWTLDFPPPFVTISREKISVNIFFQRYFLSQFSLLLEFSKVYRIFEESNEEPLFPRINALKKKKRKKGRREFLILSSIKKKKWPVTNEITHFQRGGISLRVTKRFFNFAGTKVITVARETIITLSLSLRPLSCSSNRVTSCSHTRWYSTIKCRLPLTLLPVYLSVQLAYGSPVIPV